MESRSARRRRSTTGGQISQKFPIRAGVEVSLAVQYPRPSSLASRTRGRARSGVSPPFLRCRGATTSSGALMISQCCRNWLLLSALSLSIGAMLGLVVANRLLMALDDERAASRKALEEERRIALREETAWLLRDSVQHPVIEYVADGGASVN